MKIFITRYKVIFISFLALSNLVFAACQSSSPADTNSNQTASANTNSETVKNDVDELGTHVRFDVAPEEADWKEESSGKQDNSPAGREGKKLIAVLKYKTEDADRIAAQAEKIRPAQPAQIGAETWYPEELIAQSQLSGDESLKGTAYAANDFFLEPYVNGKLTRIENTDYFVLELTSF